MHAIILAIVTAIQLAIIPAIILAIILAITAIFQYFLKGEYQGERGSLQEILRKAPFGCACCEVVFDGMNQPENYTFLDVNPAFEEMTGQKSEAILGKKATDVMPGLGIANIDWLNFCRDVVMNNAKKDVLKYLAPLGIWCRITSFLIQPNRIIVIFLNVSGDVKYIKGLKKRHRTTRELSRDFEILFNGLQEAVFLVKVKDGEFRYVMNNAEHSKLTGFSLDEIKGRTPAEVLRGTGKNLRSQLPAMC